MYYAAGFSRHFSTTACLVLVLFGLFFVQKTAAATLLSGFSETTFTSGLTNPTAMAFAPDGRLFVCQQGGQLRVVTTAGSLLATPFTTLTVDSSGERGLLGIAFDPAFATNGFIYVYYTATSPTIHNRVSRFTADSVDPNIAAAGSELPILNLDNLSGATNHNGGAIHFGPDGKLYVAVGENANSANSQSLGNRLGKILRINSDGTIPVDNPTTFQNIVGAPTGANRAIRALGLRNPYTFAFQPGSGRMFINDVGQNTWEEINDGIAASNYGWPTCEGSCADPSLTAPLFSYGHGGGTSLGFAITGGAFYDPTTATFPADYVGKYFYADFVNGWIRRFDPATSSSILFASAVSGPLDLIVANDGSLFYLARGAGSVFRVTFNSPTAAAVSVSGRVLTPEGRGLRNTVVNITDQQGGTTRAITSSLGTYRINDIRVGETYVIWVESKQYRFSPQVVNVADDLVNVDFVAGRLASRPSMVRNKAANSP